MNVLAHEQCRAVLSYFARRPTDVATLDDLADFLHDQTRPRKDETRIRTRLHHATLPRLADAGALEYDAQNNTAQYRGHPTLEALVNRLTEREAIRGVSG